MDGGGTGPGVEIRGRYLIYTRVKFLAGTLVKKCAQAALTSSYTIRFGPLARAGSVCTPTDTAPALPQYMLPRRG